MQNNIECFKFHKEWQKLKFFDTGLQDTMLYKNIINRLENQNITVLFNMDKNYNISYTISQSRNEENKPFLIITTTSNIKRSLQLLLNWLSTRQILMTKNRKG